MARRGRTADDAQRGKPKPSLAQAKVTEVLRTDLEKQLAADWAMPAVLAADASGQLFPKTLMPLDTAGLAISDAQMAEMVRFAFQAKDEEPAAFAWVRIDVDPPEIISVDLEDGAACVLTPRVDAADGTVAWESAMHAALDEHPRGGSGEGALLMRSGGREQMQADAALQEIGIAAMERLKREVEGRQVVAPEDVAEEMTFDLGAVWGHDEVPSPKSASVGLSERLRELREHAHSFKSSTCLYRIRHGSTIYLFALHAVDGLESGFLLETAVVAPGQLLEPPRTGGEDLSTLLGLGDQDE
jgi:hypothetical protein